MATGTPSDSSRRHISELGDPRHRFLAQVVEYTLAEGFRTADDFLRHFPPAKIIESLATADELRVKLLVSATGTHEKIALKKSVGSATEDLELALAERTTSAAQLLSLYPPDDRVRYLEAKKLWQFVAEDEFYRTTAADPAAHSRAAGRLTFIIESALGEGILSLREVADGITFDEIARSLPVDDLREIVRHALDISRSGSPLTEERLLSVIPLSLMISRLPLDHVWQRVVVDRVAAPAGFSDAAPAALGPPPLPTAPSSSIEVPVTVMAPEQAGEEVSAPAAAPAPEARALDEDEVRRRVVERLRQLDRLPPSHGEISTPVLLSMESMYAELWSVNDDDEREACIRESFPNETLLRTAMLALIELLDPSVDTHDPIIRDADVSGLIKIVLFEERRRRDVAPASPRRSQTPARGRRSIPPPLPRSSTPPPLPPETSRSNPPPLPAEASGGKRDR